MKVPFKTLSKPRVRACLYGARVLRRDRSRSACPGRGAFSILGDVLGAAALFVLLFGVASLGACS